MTYVITKDNVATVYPATLYQIKKAFPNTSFSLPLQDAELAPFGIYPVATGEMPSYDQETSYVEEGMPVKTASGWTQVWEVKSYSQSELADKLNQKEEIARGQRNYKLAETDYLALADGTLTDEMRAYRQALRDLPAQAGFPENINWPTKPE